MSLRCCAVVIIMIIVYGKRVFDDDFWWHLLRVWLFTIFNVNVIEMTVEAPIKDVSFAHWVKKRCVFHKNTCMFNSSCGFYFGKNKITRGGTNWDIGLLSNICKELFKKLSRIIRIISFEWTRIYLKRYLLE